MRMGMPYHSYRKRGDWVQRPSWVGSHQSSAMETNSRRCARTLALCGIKISGLAGHSNAYAITASLPVAFKYSRRPSAKYHSAPKSSHFAPKTP